MPGDPLGIRPGGESIVIAGTGGENARIARIARSGAEPGPSIDERNRAYRYELMTVVLVLAFFGLAVLWLYRRRGRANFAGLGDDRN